MLPQGMCDDPVSMALIHRRNLMPVAIKASASREDHQILNLYQSPTREPCIKNLDLTPTGKALMTVSESVSACKVPNPL